MAAAYKAKHHYFGRNLDLERSFGEKVTVTPRKMVLEYRHEKPQMAHFAFIGMAAVIAGYPLYFDATNEKGLSMAGLNFPDNAYYGNRHGNHVVASFELIPWVLSQCSDADEAEELISSTDVDGTSFSKDLPATPLHWMVSDGNRSITVEYTKDGLSIYDNPVGILTNNPPFPYHLLNLANYMNLSANPPVNRMTEGIDLQKYSRGMGSFGLPGDLSSSSRFVKAVFTKLNSECGDTIDDGLTQFFHIMASVEQQKGCCRLENGLCEHTIYASCCDADTGIYYYRTYGNSQITGVDMHECDLETDRPICFELVTGQHILMQN